MPELVRWFAENPVRWVIPAILLLAVAGTPVALWWEGRYPSSYTHGVDSAAADDAALDAAERREQGFVRSQAEWRRPGAEDEASLDRAEQAGLDAEDAARDAAEFAVYRMGALYPAVGTSGAAVNGCPTGPHGRKPRFQVLGSGSPGVLPAI